MTKTLAMGVTKPGEGLETDSSGILAAFSDNNEHPQSTWYFPETVRLFLLGNLPVIALPLPLILPKTLGQVLIEEKNKAKDG
jgi:hypothetical protein